VDYKFKILSYSLPWLIYGSISFVGVIQLWIYLYLVYIFFDCVSLSEDMKQLCSLNLNIVILSFFTLLLLLLYSSTLVI